MGALLPKQSKADAAQPARGTRIPPSAEAFAADLGAQRLVFSKSTSQLKLGEATSSSPVQNLLPKPTGQAANLDLSRMDRSLYSTVLRKDPQPAAISHRPSFRISQPTSKILQSQAPRATNQLRDVQPPVASRLPLQARLKPPVFFRLGEERRIERVTAQRLSEQSASQPSTDWHLVKPKYWWRKCESPIPHAFNPRNNPSDEHSRRLRFLSHMEGKCFHCLSTKHRVQDCRDPLRCWFCLGIGHLSSSCRKRLFKYQDQHTSPLPKKISVLFFLLQEHPKFPPLFPPAIQLRQWPGSPVT